MKISYKYLMGMVDSYLVAHLGLIAISGVSVETSSPSIQAIFGTGVRQLPVAMSKSLGEKIR